MRRRWSVGLSLPFDSVWKKRHVTMDVIAKWGIAMDGSGWWYLSQQRMVRTPEDVGPFESFEAAAACFEIMNGLK